MPFLSSATVKDIKEALWRGERQIDIADRLMISQTTISRIAQGEQWAEIEWPDGSFGAFPDSRKLELVQIAHNEKLTQRLRRTLDSLTPEQRRLLLEPQGKEGEVQPEKERQG